MVCGILSLFIGGFILGIVAIVLANMYFNETGDYGNSSAKTGKICGIIAVILSVIAIIAIIAIVASSGGHTYRRYY